MSDTVSVTNGKHTIYHLMILDESTSMGPVREETITGFNHNLKTTKEEKLAEGIEQRVSLVTFASDVTCKIWNKPVSDIENIDKKTYCPNGSTALFDAIGKSVTRLQDEIRDQIEKQDANVVVTVFTDGEENMSHVWTKEKLLPLMEELRSSRMWTFTFIGCSEETLKAAKTLGFSAANTMSYTPDKIGTSEAFAKLASSRSSYAQKVSKSMLLKGVDVVAYNSSLEEAQADFFAEDKDSGKNTGGTPQS